MLVYGLAACTAFKPKLAPPDTRNLPPRRVELPEVVYSGVVCYVHEVRWPEESLSTIARWYTGSRRHARTLVKVTPNLRTGDFLRKGDRIFIPQALARRTVAMPRSYARRHAPAPPDSGGSSGGASSDLDSVSEGETPPSPYGPRTFPD